MLKDLCHTVKNTVLFHASPAIDDQRLLPVGTHCLGHMFDLPLPKINGGGDGINKILHRCLLFLPIRF